MTLSVCALFLSDDLSLLVFLDDDLSLMGWGLLDDDLTLLYKDSTSLASMSPFLVAVMLFVTDDGAPISLLAVLARHPSPLSLDLDRPVLLELRTSLDCALSSLSFFAAT